ncbi:MAG: hypothetical protein ACQEP8_04145 [Chlamydiota bacterium]
MFRLLYTLIIAGSAVFGTYWLVNTTPQVQEWSQHAKDLLKSYLDSGEFLTLEERFKPDDIMASNKPDLLKSKDHQFIDATQMFFPYLLLEVKYTSQRKTEEGVIIWGLEDGEMVLDTDNWEKTRGFQDAINADVNRQEFKVLNALASNGGILDRERLQRTLQIDNDLIDTWIDSLRRKQLVIQNGNEYRLHLYRPKLSVKPATRIEESLVTKQYKGSKRISSRYSKSQIEKIAKAAFGSNFAIRKVTEVFLPVYAIRIKNPDGSIMTSYWNALNEAMIEDTLVL